MATATDLHHESILCEKALELQSLLNMKQMYLLFPNTQNLANNPLHLVPLK